ncbi:MAG: hypothetical protein NC100_13035 [Clostridium sp.]|nr:hypothetical protein [Clostridium sp.]
MQEIKESLLELEKVTINIDGLSSNQIKLLNPQNRGGIDKLQSYTNKINQIQSADISRFNPKEQGLYQARQYDSVLKDIEASQAALLLSTQGITNAQIRQTLAVKGLSDAEQYNAMVEAGLLTSKAEISCHWFANRSTDKQIATITNKQYIIKTLSKLY